MSLTILEPQNGAPFVGTGHATVRFRGSVLSTGHPPLFFKWYSSLNAPADPANVALNGPSVANPLDFSTPLKVGSHVITLAAKDVAADTLAALKAVQNAGMAGGPPNAQSPCIIHVYLANMLLPAAGATLSKTNSTLRAEAPSQWGRKKAGTTTTPPETEPNPDYHAVNRIRYRWTFTPTGLPAGRHSGELLLGKDQLLFQFGASATDPATVQYQGPLPAILDTGTYTLTLRVEDSAASTTGDEVSRNVVIAP